MEESTLAVEGSSRPGRSAGPWSAWFRSWYRVLRLVERPLVWLAQRRGFGNLVVLQVRGRRSGIERQTPLGLLTVAGRRYLGHPSGDTGWTLNMREAEEAVISSAQIGRVHVRAILLERGDERDAVVRASFRQHPFPGNAMYRLAGSHVAATGVFFRLEVRSDQQSGRAAAAARP